MTRPELVRKLAALVDQYDFRDVLDSLASVAGETAKDVEFGDFEVFEKSQWLRRELIRLARKAVIEKIQ